MVVLSVCICTKSGKALVARQFVDMMRIRIEGLLAAFPKLLGSDSRQHTYVETESVRYVYQTLMDNIYLLLITNRASNIIEDLDTLRLLSKVIPDIAGSTNNLTEEKISDKCFELIFAFDEVITTGGYREPITLPQIRTNLEMDSHEEKLHRMIKQSKMDQAKDQAKEAAKTIKDKLKNKSKVATNVDICRAGSSMTGIGGGGVDLTHSAAYTSESRPETFTAPLVSAPAQAPAGVSAPKQVKGISLSGAGKGAKSLEQALIEEDKLAPIQSLRSKPGTSDAAATPVVPVAVQHPVMLEVVEKVSAKMSRDGSVALFEIKGSLTLTANSDESALCSVQMVVGDLSEWVTNTHPKVNKALFDKGGLLQLKDITKGFPSQRPVGVLKWTHTGSAGADDPLIPIKVNCWPDEESRGVMNVSIEYSKDLPRVSLSNLRITIPLGTSASPNILSADGTHKHNANAQTLFWEVPMVDDSNCNGSLEFTVSQKSADAFFPIEVEFSSSDLFADLQVASVRTADGKGAILYGITKSMSTEEYTIE